MREQTSQFFAETFLTAKRQFCNYLSQKEVELKNSEATNVSEMGDCEVELYDNLNQAILQYFEIVEFPSDFVESFKRQLASKNPKQLAKTLDHSDCSLWKIWNCSKKYSLQTNHQHKLRRAMNFLFL